MPEPRKCSLNDCQGRHYGLGLCHKHYDTRRRSEGAKGGLRCKMSGCIRAAFIAGMCSGHHARSRRGDDSASPIKGRDVPAQGYLVSRGYRVVYAPEHPNSRRNGTVLQHVMVMSSLLGRPLAANENVHHRNGIRDDNRPENLELWTTSQPPGQRVSEKLSWATSFVAQYAPDVDYDTYHW